MSSMVMFDRVYKRFHLGERQDSLRDLVGSAFNRVAGRTPRESASRNEFWAVQDVSFEVHRGEALGIIGSNGAGKSTTLKLLTRILRPTRGVSRVHGRVGALIEVAAGFHPDLTGRENVYLQGAIMGMTRADVTRRFDEIVDFAGVSAFIDTPVKRYSSGMHARLGFSIAAHLEPDVLLIDEVLSVGDMQFQRRCIERMQQIKRNGTAVVFVSHDLSAVRLMCTSALLLDHGKTVCTGSAVDVINRYVGGASETRGGATKPAAVPTGRASARVIHVESASGRSLDALHPGDDLRVSLRVSLPAAIDDPILVIHVMQQETQVVAHNSNRSLHGCGGAREFDIDVSLTLNLVRGVYAISFSCFDPSRQEHVLWLRPALSVGIEELDSYAGIAHLDARIERTDAGAIVNFERRPAARRA